MSATASDILNWLRSVNVNDITVLEAKTLQVAAADLLKKKTETDQMQNVWSTHPGAESHTDLIKRTRYGDGLGVAVDIDLTTFAIARRDQTKMFIVEAFGTRHCYFDISTQKSVGKRDNFEPSKDLLAYVTFICQRNLLPIVP